MKPLTATEQATLDVLTDTPATSAEVRERSGRSRSATDKALAGLANAGLAAKAPTESDNDGPARWIRVTVDDDGDQDLTVRLDPARELGDEAIGSWEASDDAPAPAPDRDESDWTIPEPGERTEQPADDAPATDDHSGAEPDETPTPEVKICRGCQNQMPLICPCCWSRTPSYCGECRKNMPARQRGNPDEPQILPNGLPKLTRGQLEHLVAGVMRDQPVPNHVGVTGWTSARIAVFLPGRSTGAIGNALERLVTTGQAALLSETQKLYRPAQPQEQADKEEPGPPADDHSALEENA